MYFYSMICRTRIVRKLKGCCRGPVNYTYLTDKGHSPYNGLRTYTPGPEYTHRTRVTRAWRAIILLMHAKHVGPARVKVCRMQSRKMHCFNPHYHLNAAVKQVLTYQVSLWYSGQKSLTANLGLSHLPQFLL